MQKELKKTYSMYRRSQSCKKGMLHPGTNRQNSLGSVELTEADRLREQTEAERTDNYGPGLIIWKRGWYFETKIPVRWWSCRSQRFQTRSVIHFRLALPTVREQNHPSVETYIEIFGFKTMMLRLLAFFSPFFGGGFLRSGAMFILQWRNFSNQFMVSINNNFISLGGFQKCKYWYSTYDTHVGRMVGVLLEIYVEGVEKCYNVCLTS